ncbi:MAG: imidazolonepropionase [Coriobacteriia bacterium]|nr:imidazolonepropionase [Coriobacteriia bacterium]
MTATLITGICELSTCDPSQGDGSPLGIVRDAAVVVAGERVVWVGEALAAPATDDCIDLGGKAVVPGFVDSHTHLVFAGDRAAEFDARMGGEPYTGGGISTTVAATRAASREELRAHTRSLVAEMRTLGTTTVEIKSGYGLTVADEARILEVAREFTDETTFLGAHVVPAEYADDRAAYVDLVCGEMLRACAPRAHWIDVFCDTGAFDEAETRRVLSAGVAMGLGVRLHGNQLEHGPGVRLAVEFSAASVDHCTHLTDDDVAALAASDVVATLLPGSDFSTRAPYANGRRLLDAGVTVAIATDCNPGSSYVTSMPLCIALAVRETGLTPAEALYAATRGGAKALRRDDVGHLAVGAYADFAVLDAPSHLHLAYRPGSALVAQSWRRGTRT